MFGLGAGELFLIMVIALIFLGPKKLPQVAKGLGAAMREFNKAKDEFVREVRKAETEVEKEVTAVVDDVKSEMTEVATDVKKIEEEIKKDHT